MKNVWIRFGCFMTGQNYNILRGCSEAASKALKKYTAAMLIVCILWFFIGFTFAQRYLLANIVGCLLAAVIAVVIIIQIERQIILSINPGKPLLIFRGCLAFMMSILGAVIIDQILLAKDIETEKITYISNRVNEILPMKTEELRSQLFALDTSIAAKEREKQEYINEVTRNPVIKYSTSSSQMSSTPVTYKDVLGRDSIVMVSRPIVSISNNAIANPKTALIASADSTIADMRKLKTAKENTLLHIRPSLEKEMEEKVGFLDELKVMVQLISKSTVALAFWLLWILFFFFIEMLVLVSKMGEEHSDYEKAVLHHKKLQIWRLDAMAKGLDAGNAGNPG
ncbi:hypothetical protein HNQ91_000913 [Filimonas zeae]|uniref:DUF4407 domain-containing protein n=1 Tax=Filimonas zeae TaxID=1737353 RepID=A0A917IRT9_9BACT|nr:DUF4407 domain-containing protein [Filimonas zeae]MDR6337891.1 hypothetical protein [Filimonas zeae]GGH60747.1 hypothetical protein GCM10011379_08940 [Filimonas zeae]